MAIVTTYDVFCDHPECIEWATGSRESPTQARSQVAAYGWRRVRRAGKLRDLCPECVERPWPGTDPTPRWAPQGGD